MEKAINFSEFTRTFGPDPLKVEDMKNFYCKKTMAIRTGDEYNSPIEDMFENFIDGVSFKPYLLLGHKGCGKSTELNCLMDNLKKEGFAVSSVCFNLELDPLNSTYWDMLILMAEKLIEIAGDKNCEIDESLLSVFENYWKEVNIEIEDKSNANIGVESGIKASVSIPKILSLFTKVKTELKTGIETRKVIREKVKQKSSDWIKLINQISDIIAGELNNKRPILIFEDIDKLDPKTAWDLFYHYAASISQMSFFSIYTFPIGLSYDPKFGTLEGYFTRKNLPMLKTHTQDGKIFEPGIEIITEIVFKRADSKLFDAKTLRAVIIDTGGSLRDLFTVIFKASRRARRRGASIIEAEDTKAALMELSSSITQRIEEKHLETLKSIYKGNKKIISSSETLLELMQASAVLEYNGERWHDLHPLVAKFLKEQGIV